MEHFPPDQTDTDTRPAGPNAHVPHSMPALMVGALGVVFGDIGTSPLYAMQTVFSEQHNAVQATPAHITGIISLVVWALVITVTVKYVTFILRADHNGEGGILSLATLVSRTFQQARAARAAGLAALAGIIGACFFFGDSIITPAISVMSAVEGLQVAAPDLPDLVVPVAAGILIVLFAVQRFGTSGIGRVFGPIMLAWFVVIALLGLPHVLERPEILVALLPWPGVAFLVAEPLIGFIAMGAVVLVVTGAEALYADIGHFGRRPIQRSWLLIVLPALLVNYLGQGAMLLGDPAAIANPFFLLAPSWAVLPVTILSIAATVIASQAVITGAYSVARQAMRLGYLPPMVVKRTSSRTSGQIYVPAVNWILFVAVLVTVLSFRSSSSLASAYGLAVTTTFVFTSGLFLAFARRVWQWPWWAIVVAGIAFLGFELTFLAANLAKFLAGGWLPVLIGLSILVVMVTWRRGRHIVTARRRVAEGTLDDLLERLARDTPARAVGTVVFPHASPKTAPLALRLNLKLNRVLHSRTIIARVVTIDVPRVAASARVRLDVLPHPVAGVQHVTIRFGFMDVHDVPGALESACDRLGAAPDAIRGARYLLSRTTVIPASGLWTPHSLGSKLFVALTRIAASPARHYHLPQDRTIELATQVHL